MRNLKDTITTICGIIILASGIIFGLEKAGVVIPPAISTTALALGIAATSVLAYLTGKNPNGSTKSVEQVDAQNNEAK